MIYLFWIYWIIEDTFSTTFNNNCKGRYKVMRKFLLTMVLFAAVALMLAPTAHAVGTLATTAITNQAYADYDDANGNSLPRVYSNTVTTVVSQVAAVSSTPETATHNGIAGTEVEYPASICNNGNGSDTITPAAVNDLGWTVTIYPDLNNNGVWDSGTEGTPVADTGSLAADQCYPVIVVVSVPDGVLNGTLGLTTLTVTSTFDGTVVDTSVFTTDVEAAVLTLIKTATPANPQPGDTITYAITGSNSGSPAYRINVIDAIPANTTYVATSIKTGPVGGTYAGATSMTDADDVETFTTATAYYNSGTTQLEFYWPQCPPSGVLYFQVTVDSDVASGTGISNVATATYGLVADNLLHPYTESTNSSTVTVATLPGVVLDPDQSSAGDPGDQMVYVFTVQNTGNASDTFDLTYNSSAGWTWVIWKDVDGNGIPGTDGDSIVTDSGLLNALATESLLAVATIPAGTSNASVDTTVVTGTSRIDTGVSSLVTLTTTVEAPVLSVVKTVFPDPASGAQPPGTVLTYTVTVTNSGNGNATGVFITDMVPTYTTYVLGSIRTGATAGTLAVRSDATDGDGADYNSGTNAIIIPDGGSLSLGKNGTWVLEFKVTID